MAYTDLTTTFEPKLRLDWQEFDELAENDEFKHLDSGTKMVFLQASAPTGWTKDTSVNGKALRVVSGSGGGTGGTTDPSTTIALNHSHTMNSHNHTFSAHQHILDYDTSANKNVGAPWMVSSDSDGSLLYMSQAGASSLRKNQNETQTDGAGTSDNQSPATDSQLTDFTFKYFNAIVCAKD